MANAPEPGKDDCDCPACTLRRTQGKAQPGGERIQKTGGVRRTKRSGSNGGVLLLYVPRFRNTNPTGRFEREPPEINAGQRTNKRTEKEGATMKDNCKNPCMMFANPNICFIWDERLREWRHTTADRIISGLMGNYQSAKAWKQKIIARI